MFFELSFVSRVNCKAEKALHGLKTGRRNMDQCGGYSGVASAVTARISICTWCEVLTAVAAAQSSAKRQAAVM